MDGDLACAYTFKEELMYVCQEWKTRARFRGISHRRSLTSTWMTFPRNFNQRSEWTRLLYFQLNLPAAALTVHVGSPWLGIILRSYGICALLEFYTWRMHQHSRHERVAAQTISRSHSFQAFASLHLNWSVEIGDRKNVPALGWVDITRTQANRMRWR